MAAVTVLWESVIFALGAYRNYSESQNHRSTIPSEPVIMEVIKSVTCVTTVTLLLCDGEVVEDDGVLF